MFIDGGEGSILLDSGAVDRNFVTCEFVNKYNLTKYKLTYPIKVKSIHGTETTNDVVITDITIRVGDEAVDIKNVELLVINEGPTDIILGMPTMLEHRVLARLTQHLNTGGQTQGETPEKPSGGQHWTTVSCKRVKTALNVRGASKAQREAIKKGAYKRPIKC